MSVSAAHFKEVTNGYEKRSDGLWVHKGRADFGTARVVGGSALGSTMVPISGTGMESSYSPSAHTGYLSVYNRDTAVWGDLILTGKNVNLSPQSGGTVQMPNGSITGAMIADGTVGTADLAPNAAQITYINYLTSAFSTTATSAWIATPLTGTYTASGATARIEVSTCVLHSVANGLIMVGLMLDGVIQVGFGAHHSAGPNCAGTVSGVWYSVPTAGAHTWTMAIYSATVGTAGLYGGISSCLFITEQKR